MMEFSYLIISILNLEYGDDLGGIGESSVVA